MKKHLRAIITLIVIGLMCKGVSSVMGLANMFNTIMNTSYDLLMNTVFYIMAIAVVTGAFASILSYTGVIDLIDVIISPLMRPVYGLPGAASLGIISTFFSDNPAIITLIKDRGFTKHFKPYELPCLCNLGTSFGMGFVVWVFMGGQGNGGEFMTAASIGVLGAVIGSVVSTRITLSLTRKKYQADCASIIKADGEEGKGVSKTFLDAALDGGARGAEIGAQIIPGVLVICTFVMLLIGHPSESGAYTGAAFEGIDIMQYMGAGFFKVFKFLFGFTALDDLAFPLTALGSVGASLSLVPHLIETGKAAGNEIAVFTAMGMCWSGYLSTHVAMMDSIGVRKLAKPSIISHTIGGLCAGCAAHILFTLFG